MTDKLSGSIVCSQMKGSGSDKCMTSDASKGRRLGYIDAMRGFSMILVVFEHVLLLMGIPTTVTPLGAVFTTFRMPLFFFVSGYFAYNKASSSWNSDKMKLIMKKKVQAQIIGTLFFYTLFHLCFHDNILGWIDDGFGWFWFTIVLFQMYVVYVCISILEKVMHSRRMVDVAMVCLSIISFIIFVKGSQFDFKLWRVLSWYNLCCYFQFFTFGILARKYSDTFIGIINNKNVKPLIIVSFIVFLILSFGLNNSLSNYSSALGNMSQMLVVRYLGLMTVFIFFYTYRELFDSEGYTVKSLKYIGSRTLDIYMLHMFFVPDLKFMGAYFLNGTNLIIIQLLSVLAISVAIVGVCLLVSMVLRSSSVLAEWLLGARGRTV